MADDCEKLLQIVCRKCFPAKSVPCRAEPRPVCSGHHQYSLTALVRVFIVSFECASNAIDDVSQWSGKLQVPPRMLHATSWQLRVPHFPAQVLNTVPPYVTCLQEPHLLTDQKGIR